MARGRFIDNKIVLSKQVSLLSDDTCRLMFTWMVTFADREGRLFGDPALIRGAIFPRNEKITVKKVDGYLQELSDVGLIIWYEAKGDKYILFPGFSSNQMGLRKDREPASDFPPPPKSALTEYARKHADTLPEEFRQHADNVPAEVNLTEVNLNQVNRDEDARACAREVTRNAFEVYEQGFGGINSHTTEKILDAIEDYTETWVIAALEVAIENNKRSWSYAEAILKRWRVEGFKSDRRKYERKGARAPVNQGLEAIRAMAEADGETLDGVLGDLSRFGRHTPPDGQVVDVEVQNG